MSNVIKLHSRECADRAAMPPVETGIDGFQSLFKSWSSIMLSFSQLQHYIDDLRPVIEGLPDGLEKSSAILLIKETEIQIQQGRTRSIGAIAAVTRALVVLTVKAVD